MSSRGSQFVSQDNITLKRCIEKISQMDLLKLDRWKLFLLISPVSFIIVIIISIFIPPLENVLEFLILIEQIFLFIWYYQIGIQLQKNTSELNIKKFKLSFLVVCTLLGSSFAIRFYHEYILNEAVFEWMRNENEWMRNENSSIRLLRTGISLLLGFPAIIYIFYFNVKTLLSLKNPAWPYNGLQTTLFLLYASVFGALLLQPKINKHIELNKIPLNAAT
jgi:hypothetical protein